MTRSSRRWIWTGLGLLLLIVIATEITLRVFYGVGDPLLLRSDPDIGYIFRANQTVERRGHEMHINAFHQRSEDIYQQPPEGTFRILVIGDSVTFGGTHVDQSETLTAYLENELAQRGNKKVQVLNASAGSWGIRNEKAYLERFGLIGSELLIWQIGSHDLYQGKSTGEQIGRHPAMPDEKPWSAIGEMFSRVLWPRILRPHLQWFLPSDKPEELPTDAELQQQLTANLDAFAEGVRLARSAGAHMLVLHTPDQFEVTGGMVPAPHKKNYPMYRDRFLQTAVRLDVPVVNLLEHWRDQSQADSWYRDGVHFTAAGNRTAAQLLAQKIQEYLAISAQADSSAF